MATDPETTLSPEALRLTIELIWAVDTHPDIHVNRFTVRRNSPDYFEYFLGHHRANTPTPLRQYQRLDYNVVPQLQFLGFVEVAQGEHIPKGWYRFTEKALQWYRARHEAETRIPTTNPSPAATVDAKKFDVFISHASEDKDVIVRPL